MGGFAEDITGGVTDTLAGVPGVGNVLGLETPQERAAKEAAALQADAVRSGQELYTQNLNQALDVLRGSRDPIEDLIRGGSRASINNIERGTDAARGRFRDAHRFSKRNLADMLDAQLGTVGEGFDAARGQYQEALGLYDPIYQQGVSAMDLLSQFSGAAGRDAQADAFANYQQDPYSQFLQQQQADALERSAAASGGLFSGNTMDALQQNAANYSLAGLQQQQNLLNQLAGYGYGAAGDMSNIYGNIAGLDVGQAGLESDLYGNYYGSLMGSRDALAANMAGLDLSESDKIAGVKAGRNDALINMINNLAANESNILLGQGTQGYNYATDLGTALAQYPAFQAAQPSTFDQLVGAYSAIAGAGG